MFRTPFAAVCALGSLVSAAPVMAQAAMLSKVQNGDTIHNIGARQIAIGVGVLAAVFIVDAPVAHVFETTPSAGTQNTARQLDRFGDASGITVVLGGLGLASLITRKAPVVQATVHTAEAVIIASGIAQVTKYAVGRTRPFLDPDRDGFDFHSQKTGSPAFPSGHSTIAFALATSLGDAVNRDWVRVGLYGLASATAWARLRQQQHWVSDVVAGAAIGIVSAKFAEGRLHILGIRAPQIHIGVHSAGIGWHFEM